MNYWFPVFDLRKLPCGVGISNEVPEVKLPVFKLINIVDPEPSARIYKLPPYNLISNTSACPF